MAIPVPGIDQEETWAATAPRLGPGKHTVDIVEAEEGSSPNNNPQIMFQLRKPGTAEEIRDWLVIVPQTFGKVKQYLEAAKVPVPSGDDATLSAGPFVGKRINVTVALQPNNKGENEARVIAWEPMGQTGSDIPADGTGLPNGSGQSADDKIPF